MNKQLHVFYGPIDNQQSVIVELSAVSPTDTLTPAIARRAAIVAQGGASGATVWDHEDGRGYRLYPNSARKLRHQPEVASDSCTCPANSPALGHHHHPDCLNYVPF